MPAAETGRRPHGLCHAGMRFLLAAPGPSASSRWPAAHVGQTARCPLVRPWRGWHPDRLPAAPLRVSARGAARPFSRPAKMHLEMRCCDVQRTSQQSKHRRDARQQPASGRSPPFRGGKAANPVPEMTSLQRDALSERFQHLHKVLPRHEQRLVLTMERCKCKNEAALWPVSEAMHLHGFGSKVICACAAGVQLE